MKIVSLKMVAMATGLLAQLVPGATPKNPFSRESMKYYLSQQHCAVVCVPGLMARSWPVAGSGLSQAMSSPITETWQYSTWHYSTVQYSTVQYITWYPGSLGDIMARFVFPQAEGKAAVMYFFSPCSKHRLFCVVTLH